MKKEGNKKSWKVTEKDIKIIRILKNNPEGLRAKTISKLSGISPNSSLYYHLNKLMESNFIENIFPIWKIPRNQASSLKLGKLLSSDKIQLHKFSFVLKLIDKPIWWEKRSNKLLKLKEFHIKPDVDWGNNKYQQISKDSFLIHIFKNTIVFINQKEYYGSDTYDCFISALEDTLNMYNFLEQRFNFKFFKDGIPQFSVKSSHYVKLRDAFAKRYKKEKKRFKLMINNELRAWIDLSDPFGTEFGHKDYNVEDGSRYDKIMEDILNNNPPVLSEIDNQNKFLLDNLNKLTESHITTQNQMGEYAEHLNSHKDAIIKLGKGIEEHNKSIKELTKLIKKLRS